jgi:hypothetical protein
MYHRHKFLDIVGMEGLFKLERDDARSDIYIYIYIYVKVVPHH